MQRDHETRHHCLRSGAARALSAALQADAGAIGTDARLRILIGRSPPPALAAVYAIRTRGGAGGRLERCLVLCGGPCRARVGRVARGRAACRPDARLRVAIDRRLSVSDRGALRRWPLWEPGDAAASRPTPPFPPPPLQ